jgi:Fic family protein
MRNIYNINVAHYGAILHIRCLSQGGKRMLSFQLTVDTERQMKALQALLVRSATELARVPLQERTYLNHFALISNVGASTRIENAVLTDIEIDWVDSELARDDKPTAFEEKKRAILDKLSKDRERSVEEVVGERQVLTTLYSQAKDFRPLTESTIRGLHHDLLRFYPPAERYAGRYKAVSNRVIAKNHESGEERVVLEPAAPGVMTEMAMRDLVDWYNANLKEHPWPILVGVEFTFRFLAIHPFQDGNGRLGRALFLMSLLHSGDEYLEAAAPYVAIDRHIEKNKALYYLVLQQCSDGKFQEDASRYRYESLCRFFLTMIGDGLADIAIYRKRYADLQALSETAVAVLACFKSSPEQRLQVAKIESITGFSRRTIQYALKTLADQQFLQKLGKGAGSRYQLVF